MSKIIFILILMTTTSCGEISVLRDPVDVRLTAVFSIKHRWGHAIFFGLDFNCFPCGTCSC